MLGLACQVRERGEAWTREESRGTEELESKQWKSSVSSSFHFMDHCTLIIATIYKANRMPSPTLQPCTQSRVTEDSLTKEQYRHIERQINFQLHVSLMVEHASRCQSLACLSSNCQKMKFYLKHGLACKVSGCHLCKRTKSLLRIHAQQCQIDTSPSYVPEHISLQECILQLRKNMKAAASVEV